jgi:uncharacterized membrane protein AbrB (regulator of aidB expression)
MLTHNSRFHILRFKKSNVLSFHWEMPKGFNFILQVALGIMVGASFQPAMLLVLKKLFLPVFASTVTLVGTGILLSLIFARLSILEAPAAYLGTSPSAAP